MIVTITLVRTSRGVGRLRRYLETDPANDAIRVYAGAWREIAAGFEDAYALGARYAGLHVTVNPSPGERWDASARAHTIAVVTEELGLAEPPAVQVEHERRRTGHEAPMPHLHLVANRVDPVSGARVPDRKPGVTKETVARRLELDLGHALTPGRFNRQVADRMAARGRAVEAAQVRAADADRPSRARFKTGQLRRARQRGVDLPALADTLSAAWAAGGATAVADAIAEHGLTVAYGWARALLTYPGTGQALCPLAHLTRINETDAVAVVENLEASNARGSSYHPAAPAQRPAEHEHRDPEPGRAPRRRREEYGGYRESAGPDRQRGEPERDRSAGPCRGPVEPSRPQPDRDRPEARHRGRGAERVLTTLDRAQLRATLRATAPGPDRFGSGGLSEGRLLRARLLSVGAPPARAAAPLLRARLAAAASVDRSAAPLSEAAVVRIRGARLRTRQSPDTRATLHADRADTPAAQAETPTEPMSDPAQPPDDEPMDEPDPGAPGFGGPG